MAITLDRITALFGKRSFPALGVDLGASSVRLVGLNKDFSGALSVNACLSERLQSGWVVSGNIENFKEVADAMNRLVVKSSARTKDIVMALPTAAVVTRRVKVPRDLAAEDFQAQVEAEVGQYLPWSIEEASIDYHLVASASDLPEVEVLVAAARRDMVEERASLAEEAGLNLVALDLETFARARSANRVMVEKVPDASRGLVAVIEIGSLSTLFQVSKNDEIIYDRDLSFGGAHLTQLVERVYGLESVEAERQKRAHELPSGFESKVVAPYISNVASEIERELHIFHSKSGLARVTSIVLSGGGACLPGFAKAVASQTGLPSVLANPFAGIGIGSESLKVRLKTERPAYLTAMGLALRGVIK